jgi:hypothetical protein
VQTQMLPFSATAAAYLPPRSIVIEIHF